MNDSVDNIPWAEEVIANPTLLERLSDAELEVFDAGIRSEMEQDTDRLIEIVDAEYVRRGL